MKNNFPDNERAIWIIKKHGPQPLKAIAKELNVTTEGARFALLKLANEGLVKATTFSRGRGRPQQIWELTELGNSRFPDTHAELTARLITIMRETLGEEGLQTVITANEKKGISKYSEDLQGVADLEGRIKRLAEIRDKEGYMAEYKKEENGFLLIENHCPICIAASACQGFCSSELNTFRAVLGNDVKIERIDHILQGARRCAYRITPVDEFTD